jgi:hypothetical protein
MPPLRPLASALLLFAFAASIADSRAQDKKKVDPKAPEVEKLLLAVPEDVAQGEWIKAWREKVVMTFSDELTFGARGQLYSGDIVKFSLENKTPCAIKVRSDLTDSTAAGRLAGLKVEGQPTKKPDPKAKDDKPAPESWTVEPGKKLALSRKPKVANRVIVVPLKNDLDKKALVSSITTGPLCTLELVPTDKDAKPLELVVVTKVGMAGAKVVVSGYYLCKPDGVKKLMDKLSKFN